MKYAEQAICDRCGAPKVYITIDGTNGMIAWGADLCVTCFNEIKALMLNRNNRSSK